MVTARVVSLHSPRLIPGSQQEVTTPCGKSTETMCLGFRVDFIHNKFVKEVKPLYLFMEVMYFYHMHLRLWTSIYTMPKHFVAKV